MVNDTLDEMNRKADEVERVASELNDAAVRLNDLTDLLADTLNMIDETTKGIDEVIEKKRQVRIESKERVDMASPTVFNVRAVEVMDLDSDAEFTPDFIRYNVLTNDFLNTEAKFEVNSSTESAVTNHFLNDLRDLLSDMYSSIGNSILSNGYYIVLERIDNRIYVVMIKDKITGKYTWCKVGIIGAEHNTFLKSYHEYFSGRTPVEGFGKDTIYFSCDLDRVVKWEEQIFHACNHDLINASIEYLKNISK